MEITREHSESGFAVIETKKGFHVVQVSEKRDQVYSVLSSDSPRDGGQWFGRLNEFGVNYVSRARSRSAAMAAFRRIVREFVTGGF